MMFRGGIGVVVVLAGMVSVARAADQATAAPAAPSTPPVLRVDREVGAVRQLALEAGQNRLLVLSEPIGRVAVADPNVADLKVVTPSQILLTARGVGATDLTLWNRNDQPLVIALEVTRSVEPLRRQLKELFPREQVTVSAAGDLVVLAGQVSDVRTPERMAEVARLHAKQVANLITVSGNHQVQLQVRFAEVSRGGLKEVGVNLYGATKDGRQLGGALGPKGTLGGYLRQNNTVPGTAEPGGTPPPIFAQQPINGAFQLFFGSSAPFPFNVTLSMLEENGLARVLAEPTLVTLSGQEARFLAGGELPVPLASSFGSINVQWKKFGIQLAFTPTVLDPGTISLKLAAEVSDLDPANGISVSGVVIPGLTSRQAETTVRLGDGESFAVAGLLSDKVRSTMDQVPWLGNLPIIGMLFRSSAYKRDETELLVVVTVRLVQPVAPGTTVALPTDFTGDEAGTGAFFLLGQDEVGGPRGPAGAAGFSP